MHFLLYCVAVQICKNSIAGQRNLGFPDIFAWMFFLDGDSEHEFRDRNLILNKREEESEIVSE